MKLIQEDLEEPDQYGTGTTFLFEVNGVRMFMGGDWYLFLTLSVDCLADSSYRLKLDTCR